MRDKAEVLVEVDRLTRVQVELTAEVQSLHAQLEQEKSKVHYLTEKDHKGKDKVCIGNFNHGFLLKYNSLIFSKFLVICLGM